MRQTDRRRRTDDRRRGLVKDIHDHVGGVGGTLCVCVRARVWLAIEMMSASVTASRPSSYPYLSGSPSYCRTFLKFVFYIWTIVFNL